MVVKRRMRNPNNHLSKTYKDNPSKEILLLLVAPLSLFILSLLATQVTPLLQKLNLDSNKVHLLDKRARRSLIRINLTSDIPKSLTKRLNPLVS